MIDQSNYRSSVVSYNSEGTTQNEMLQYSASKAYLAAVKKVFEMPQIDDPTEQAVVRVAYGDDTRAACIDRYAETEGNGR